MRILSFARKQGVYGMQSMQGQKALGFRQKYLHLCSNVEQRSYKFGTTWGWEIDARLFIFGWTIHLRHLRFTGRITVKLKIKEPFYFTDSEKHQKMPRVPDYKHEQAIVHRHEDCSCGQSNKLQCQNVICVRQCYRKDSWLSLEWQTTCIQVCVCP